MALHKIGAIAIPATNQLLTKDIVYRVNAASVKAVVATSDGNVTEMVDEGPKETETLKKRIVTRAHREGWHNYEEGINSAPQFVKA